MRCLRISFAALLSAACALAQLSSVPNNAPNTPGPSLAQAKGGRVAWLSGVTPLGAESRHNDFPSVAIASNGDIWTVWSSYSGLREEIHARRFSAGVWYASFPIPGVSGDVWSPQVALDEQGRPWFVWSQETNYPNTQSGKPNWDLFAARLDGAKWTGPIRLTDNPLPDIHHRVVADSHGKLWLAWQGFRDGQSDIFLRTCEAGVWSHSTTQISSDPADDWSPDIAVDSAGNATVVWDTYRHGNYDVYMKMFRNGQWGPETPITSTPGGETNATAVYDHQGRLWVAYEDWGPNWGKDSGARTLGVKSIGTRIGQSRAIRMKVLDGSRWMAPAADPASSMLESEQNALQSPRLYCDHAGRVWMLFKHKVEHAATWSRPWQVESDLLPLASGYKVFWNTFATYYNGAEWMPATGMPVSRDRISSVASAAAAPNGQFWVLWHTDNRDDSQVQYPRQNQVYSGVLTPSTPALESKLVPEKVIQPIRSGAVGDEAGDVKFLRSATVTIGDKPYRIYRGDLHRHTEFSTDGGGSGDGSVPEFFRYMLDAAAMDFGAVTDHNAGGDVEYWWWLIQKFTEMHQVPGRYLALFGYERSTTYPNGHRNIIHPFRNIPVVKNHYRADVPEYWSTYEAVSRDMVDNDTKLLYEDIRKTGGIAISHTSATNMGTDWRDNDPGLEPVVEIFQGARASYEHDKGFGAVKPGSGKDGAYQPKGFVWNAWAKGYRLGTIASSDHGSTHLSYALVYSNDASRQGIVEAIRKRRTYAATDNIYLEYWMGDHFMGDDFKASKIPDLRVKIRGTAPVDKVSIIRNNQYISEQSPGKQDVAFTFRDNNPVAGTSYYYLRITQTDGQTAWSSPIWVTWTKP